MFNFSFCYTLILLVLMTIFLVKEIFDPDIVIFSSLLLLSIGRVITIKEAFVGFSNSGMLTVGFFVYCCNVRNFLKVDYLRIKSGLPLDRYF